MSETAITQSDQAPAAAILGCAPTGYLNARGEAGPKAVIDPDLGPLVAEAFVLAAESQMPLRGILEEMTGKGLVSRNGKTMKVAAFWYLLTNPFYRGLVRRNGELLRGSHAPLVSEKTFEAVRRSLARNRRNPGKS